MYKVWKYPILAALHIAHTVQEIVSGNLASVKCYWKLLAPAQNSPGPDQANPNMMISDDIWTLI